MYEVLTENTLIKTQFGWKPAIKFGVKLNL